MSNKAKRIATILANADVRDPRETLDAIDQIIKEKRIKAPAQDANDVLNATMRKMLDGASTAEVPHQEQTENPVGTIEIFNDPNGSGPLKVKTHFTFCANHLQPRHVLAAMEMLTTYYDERCES